MNPGTQWPDRVPLDHREAQSGSPSCHKVNLFLIGQGPDDMMLCSTHPAWALPRIDGHILNDCYMSNTRKCVSILQQTKFMFSSYKLCIISNEHTLISFMKKISNNERHLFTEDLKSICRFFFFHNENFPLSFWWPCICDFTLKFCIFDGSCKRFLKNLLNAFRKWQQVKEHASCLLLVSECSPSTSYLCLRKVT